MNEMTTKGILSTPHVGGGFTDSRIPYFFNTSLPKVSVNSGMHIVSSDHHQVIDAMRQTVGSLSFFHGGVTLLYMALSSKRDAMCRKLEGYANLASGWDGDDGHAPAKVDIDNAIKFMDFIPPKGIFLAQLMVAGDGDVGFEWDMKDRCLEVGFCDGDISFYGKMPPERKVKGDFRFEGVTPKNLAEFIKTFFGR